MKALVLFGFLLNSVCWGQFFEADQEPSYSYHTTYQNQFFSDGESIYNEPPADYEVEDIPGNPNEPLPIDNGWYILMGIGLVLGVFTHKYLSKRMNV